MIQRQLDGEVAKTPGKDIREVRRHGFRRATTNGLVHAPDDDDVPPHVLDWESNYPGIRVTDVTSFDDFYEPRAA